MTRYALAALLVLLLVVAEPASGQQLRFGISDTGRIRDFHRQNQRLDDKVTGLQTFHPWGNKLNQAIPRWQRAAVRPMLHISTGDDQSGRELITPYGIAAGDGDRYLLALNHQLGKLTKITWLRPMGEVNRMRNPYGAFTPSGVRKGWRHSPAQYRRAFQRIAIIVRGGAGRQEVNRNLRRAQLPALKTSGAVSAPAVKTVWSPLPSNLGVSGNGPGKYWPGARYVDIVGTSFFSAWSSPVPLNSFYRRFDFGKPFILAEWGLNSDDPRFSNFVFDWCQRKARCRGLFFYRGFPGDRFDFRYHPQAESAVEQRLRLGPFIPWSR